MPHPLNDVVRQRRRTARCAIALTITLIAAGIIGVAIGTVVIAPELVVAVIGERVLGVPPYIGSSTTELRS